VFGTELSRRYRRRSVTTAPHLPGLGPDDEPEVTPPEPAFRVEVVRSAKRRKTVGARMVGGVLRITVPSWMKEDDITHWIDVMSRRFMRAMSAERLKLDERVVALARRFDLPAPRSIRWSDDMVHRWGSCTIDTATIRLSTRLAAFPDWVVDYVIVHELAHLQVAEHSSEFWQLVYRFPKAERAIGYLIAKSGDGEDVD
jgi:predicted metal-dependent hydrolase